MEIIESIIDSTSKWRLKKSNLILESFEKSFFEKKKVNSRSILYK